MPDTDYAFRIETTPQYLPEQSDPAGHRFAFAYTITITNTGRVPAQLIARHWLIEDANGHTEEVNGLGVVGEQPLLAPGQAFQYTSGCQLRSSHGIMHGRYFFVAVDDHRFDVPIAAFILQSGSAGQAGRTLH
ncbi:MAG: Co2+/Mg2+ efflux protein ApaG [Betaproteobacteria bacterium]|nr:Co2+/Mg2+ efflux protein ApaG [Betaproteobacteria bacterium]